MALACSDLLLVSHWIKLMFLSAVHLSRAISKKEVSCKEIMQLTLNRIDSLNPGFNAIVAAADSGQLLRQAARARSSRRGC